MELTLDDWRLRAICSTTEDPDLWFPEKSESDRLKEAQLICHNCPVKSECRADAEGRGEKWGVWGGEPFEIKRQHRGGPRW